MTLTNLLNLIYLYQHISGNMPKLPSQIVAYIAQHTREGSKMRKDLVKLLVGIAEGKKVRYKDIKSKSVIYHIKKLMKLNLLVTVRTSTSTYISINPEVVRDD